MKLRGVTRTELHQLRDTAALLAATQVRQTLATTVRHARGRAVSLDDLARIRGEWANRIDAKLRPHLWATYWRGVDTIREQLAPRIAVTAAPPRDPDPIGAQIARVSDPVAQAWMANAANRLVAVGDEIWEHARAELVTGMAAGEGITALADRVATASALLAVPRAEVIARTEVNSAANAGATTQLRTLDVPATKTWLATTDPRTREAHLDADGQQVGINDSFTVDGESLDFPGDPSGSPGNVINCRCTCTYDIPDDDVDALAQAGEEHAAGEEAVTAAAADEEHTGAMIALVPAPSDLDRLALTAAAWPDPEPREELHLTLFYLGDAVDWKAGARSEIIDRAGKLFAGFGTVTANAFGVNYWNPNSDQPAWVLAVGDGEETGLLHDVRETAEQVLTVRELPIPELPAQHTPWVPHICLAYDAADVQDSTRLNEMIPKLGPITFDRVRVAFGPDVHDVTL